MALENPSTLGFEQKVRALTYAISSTIMQCVGTPIFANPKPIVQSRFIRFPFVVPVLVGCAVIIAVIARRSAEQTTIKQKAPAPAVAWIESTSPHALSIDSQMSETELIKIASDANEHTDVRGQAIYHLAIRREQASVDPLINLLDDSSPLVRGRAASALRTILGTDFYYRAGDNRAKRLEIADGIRRYWKSRQPPHGISQPTSLVETSHNAFGIAGTSPDAKR